ncbi:MAG: lipid-A-disaccharide synthase-related protein [Cyanobacteria bacterium P01_F01_bin.150]
MVLKLLCLSNGHGEDTIALRILRALQSLDYPPGQAPEIAALPLVGEGHAYANANIPVVGPVKAMPSGGFIYMDNKQLVRDVKGGLVSLTLDQIKTIRQWGKSGGSILAVGDVVPLSFAWLSRVPYAFVGTAKSEYYLKDENGPIPRRTWFEQLENWSGSVYLPIDRWFMERPNCKAVIPRDTITTQILKQWDIPAYDLGNPMMDSLEPTGDLVLPAPVLEKEKSIDQSRQATQLEQSIKPTVEIAPIEILLLPGSRAPEAHRNWRILLNAMASVQRRLGRRPLVFLAAIAPSLDLTKFVDALGTDWHVMETDAANANASTLAFRSSAQPTSFLIVGQTIFNDSLHQADMAIALAGTATEQFVGLGKPAITIPGEGPQFTPAFAEAQTRLLGPSIIPVQAANEVGGAIAQLLDNPDQLAHIRRNGQHRMGAPGAAARIAQCLVEVLS